MRHQKIKKITEPEKLNHEEDLEKLTKEDLELLKLKKEVYLLREQVNGKEGENVGFINKSLNYLQSNIGKIVAIVALIGTVVDPVFNFIGSERKAKLIEVSNQMFKVVDSNRVDASGIEEISTQDPAIVAPYLLNLANEGKITRDNTRKIFTRMYKLNAELSSYSFFDKLVFLFSKDNKEVMEDELATSAAKAFSKKLATDDEKLYEAIATHLDIIYELRLQNKKSMKRALDILRDKCKVSDVAYQTVCGYLDTKEKNNATK